MLRLRDFSVNYTINPTLVPTKDLRFGWRLESDKKGVLQQSYRITLEADGVTLADSGEVLSSQPFDNAVDGLCLNLR